MISHEARKYFFFLVFCTIIISTLATCVDEERKQYVIRNVYSGFVLEVSATNYIIIEYFTGSPNQLWSFEYGSSPGLFFIVNNNTGKVIDFTSNPAEAGYPLLILNTQSLSNSLNQQWFINERGRIWNAAAGKNLDIHNDNYVPGIQVGLSEENNGPAQGFMLQQIGTCI